MCIVNESYCETIISDPNEDLGLNVDGTGSYMLESVSDNGDVTLTRFADAWAPATIETIYLKYITGSQETAFEAGDLDYAMYGATNYEIIKEYDNVLTQEQVLNGIVYLINNCVEGQPCRTSACATRPPLPEHRGHRGHRQQRRRHPAYNIATPLSSTTRTWRST